MPSVIVVAGDTGKLMRMGAEMVITIPNAT
jgi:hypothetical protein